MPAKPETRFIGLLNNRLPIKKRRESARSRAAYPERHIHYEKMNNPYSSGTFDGWYSGKRDLWIEFKYLPTVPVRATVSARKLLSELQFNWGNERHEEGRAVAVIIGCPAGGVVLVDRAWEQDLSADQFKTLMLSLDDLAAWVVEQVL
jgi:hypothetical protein